MSERTRLPSCRPHRRLNAAGGVFLNVTASIEPAKEDFGRDQGMVCLRRRVLDPVDAIGDVLGRDLAKLLPSERKVPIEQPAVVLGRPRADPFFRGGQEQRLCVIECDALGKVLAQSYFAERALCGNTRVLQFDVRVSSDLVPLAALDQDDERLGTALGHSQAEAFGVRVPVGHRPLRGGRKAPDRDVSEGKVWHRFGTAMGRVVGYCYLPPWYRNAAELLAFGVYMIFDECVQSRNHNPRVGGSNPSSATTNPHTRLTPFG